MIVDEQMCARKACHHIKMYISSKPHKYGYKLVLLCGVSGYAYKVEMYTGQENERDRIAAKQDLGASGKVVVVVRLCRNVPENVNHKIYFNNYYTSLPLLYFLKRKGVLSLGTVRRNRIHNNKLPDEKTLNKEPRGAVFEYIGNYQRAEISNVFWLDNKVVSMLSTFVGSDPISNIRRYERKKKEHVSVPCPKIVQIYTWEELTFLIASLADVEL